MNYDDKYPYAKCYDEVEVGLVKMCRQLPCRVCKEYTYWLDVDHQVMVCSDRCRMHFDKPLKKEILNKIFLIRL